MWWRKAVRYLFWTAVFCGILAGIVLIFFAPWTVPGDDAQFAVSIEPTLSPGDVILVLRSTGTGDGALVRCTDPDSPGRFVVGRVVGNGGDKVEFSKGTMLINGKTPSSSSACDPAVLHLKNPATQEDEEFGCTLEELGGGTHPAIRASSGAAGARDSTADVEASKAFLTSDNRTLHLDSRDFGTIPSAGCQHIALRLWGLSGWGDAKKRLTVLW